MVLGLLTVHLLGVGFFAWACIRDPGDLASHIWVGLISVMLVVFAHVMSYFYLVAMTSVIRKALAGESGPPVLVDDPRGPEILGRSRVLKSGVAPWALGGMFLPMIPFILGGAAHTRFFPPWVHSGASWLGLAFLLAALMVVGLGLLRQNRLIEAFQLAAHGAPESEGPAPPGTDPSPAA